MKSFLSILTFLLVLVTILSSSIGLICHVCTATTKGCDLNGGPEVDCNMSSPNASLCYTSIGRTGSILRDCLDPAGLKWCNKINKLGIRKCETCSYDKCNTKNKL